MDRSFARGATVALGPFTFTDAAGATVDCTSAELQLTYPGNVGFETEAATITEAVGHTWSGTWDSSKARPGWVTYHAHGVASSTDYVVDGRFRLVGNIAGLDHDRIPTNGRQSDYELLP